MLNIICDKTCEKPVESLPIGPSVCTQRSHDKKNLKPVAI